MPRIVVMDSAAKLKLRKLLRSKICCSQKSHKRWRSFEALRLHHSRNAYRRFDNYDRFTRRFTWSFIVDTRSIDLILYDKRQRALIRAIVKELEDRFEAFAMVSHKRLGGLSVWSTLPAEIAKEILMLTL